GPELLTPDGRPAREDGEVLHEAAGQAVRGKHAVHQQPRLSGQRGSPQKTATVRPAYAGLSISVTIAAATSARATFGGMKRQDRSRTSNGTTLALPVAGPLVSMTG